MIQKMSHETLFDRFRELDDRVKDLYRMLESLNALAKDVNTACEKSSSKSKRRAAIGFGHVTYEQVRSSISN